MRQHDCTDAIGPVHQLPDGSPALARLWLTWLAARLQSTPDRLLVCLDRSRQRGQLGRMDERMLRDIGVSRSAAFAETRKWFWQP